MSQLVERIHGRCEEVGECWEWQGAVQKRSRTPVMRHNGKQQCVRRWLAEALGRAVDGKVVTYRCRNHLCCKPEHLQVMTEMELRRRTSKTQQRLFSMPRRQRAAEARRVTAKLTPEQVENIREDIRPQRAIAKAFGISQTTVSRIKRGEMWRDYTNPFFQLL